MTSRETTDPEFRKMVLLKAENLVNGDRAATYGDPLAQYEKLASLWGAYLGIEMGAQDALNLLILMKVHRSTISPNHTDNYVDIAGYAAVEAEVMKRLAS